MYKRQDTTVAIVKKPPQEDSVESEMDEFFNDNTDPNVIACNICKKVFRSNRQLFTHQQNKHAAVAVKEEIKESEKSDKDKGGGNAAALEDNINLAPDDLKELSMGEGTCKFCNKFVKKLRLHVEF